MKDTELAGWMWTEACELIDQAERLHRQFFRVGSRRERMPVWEPPIDVFESDGELSICIALPGVAADNIEVVIKEDVLTVAGMRPMLKRGQTALIHRLEIPQGLFERRIRLPARAMKVTHSVVENGCLSLTLQKI
jgi:HSP20 family molecular chaperone IbpA